MWTNRRWVWRFRLAHRRLVRLVALVASASQDGQRGKVRLKIWVTTGDVGAVGTSATVSARTVSILLAAMTGFRLRVITAMIAAVTVSAAAVIVLVVIAMVAVTALAAVAPAVAAVAPVAAVAAAAAAVSTACPLRLSAPAKAQSNSSTAKRLRLHRSRGWWGRRVRPY